MGNPLSGLFGSSKQSGSTQTTTTQNNNPWSGQQPYLEKLFSEAGNLYDKGGPQYYPGQTLADVSPYTQTAVSGMADRAMTGSPVQQNANTMAAGTLAGNYLNNNPYLDQTFNRAADQVEGRMRSAWGGDDSMTGSSGLQQAALGNSLSGLANDIYGGNYQQERGRQAAMAALAPQLAASDYNDFTQLAAAGDIDRSLGQQQINDDIQRYNYDQNLPYMNLQNFGQMISGNYGGSGTQTSTNPHYQSSVGIIPGAMMGGMLGNQLFGSGMGTGGGAVLGGLMGNK